MRKWNFCAGPAVISEQVLSEVKDELLEWGDSGMSIMEMSHRSKIYDGVAVDAKQDFIDILNVPPSHEVLFLQGGATHQFSMVPLNFAHNNNADYVLSGSWSKKAIAEASKLTKVNTIASSENHGFSYAPTEEDWKYSEDSAYVHYCPNETIQGVAIHEAPDINNHLIADMSSVILSEPLDVSKFSLIYAGAQKNIGPAGLTMVIIKKDLMELENKNLPNILRYSKHSESDSMLNTPPTFAWYMAGKVFKWIKQSGGLEFFKEQNHLKASTLYNYIDNSTFYSNPVKVENRSIMNVPFILADNDLDSVFLKESEGNGFLNLKGHRSVGGMRASIYNAMPLKGINELVDFMEVFEAKYG
jgi:phosphoserine aminotransferase